MSYSYKLNSHEDRLLINHLSSVACISRQKVEKSNICFMFPKEILAETASIIGVSHDIGKATKYFQDFLRDSIMGKAVKKDRELKEHGFFSGVAAFALVNLFIEKYYKEDGMMSYLPYIAFFVVKHHHGRLIDLDNEVMGLPGRLFKSKTEVVKKQWQALDIEEVLNILSTALGLQLEEKEFEEIYWDAFDKVTFKDHCAEDIMDELVRQKNPEFFFLEKFLFSVLVSADKTDVILGAAAEGRAGLPHDLIDRYLRDKKGERAIDEIRQQAYMEVVQKAYTIDINRRVLSISLPTGLGKTFTSVSFALNLAERLKTYSGYDYRLVYCLPFTSIIDQNYSVIEGVFKAVNGKDPLTSEIMKHHYLSDVSYRDENEEYTLDKSQHLINNWESTMVITTFVQFFHTLFSNGNKALTKFSSMANSIIILDEVQAIPYRYWLLLNVALPVIAEKMNIYFVLVTATQPLIFREERQEITELVERRGYYFSLFERTKIYIHTDRVLHIEEFCHEMVDLLNQKPDKDVLIILNTIKSSKEVFRALVESGVEDTEFVYLSTNVVPKHRQQRIKNIGKDTGKRKVVVSTQLIEAGVDIDMDIVVRDIGPWDSIIQAAGRANRHNSGKDGEVHVYILRNDQKEYYRYIYKENALTVNKTLEIINQRKVISEQEYGDITREYFKKIHYDGDASANQSIKILESIWGMMFEKVNNEFKLIDNLDYKVDVFVEVDECAKKVWDKFQKLKEIETPYERNREFLRFKKDFYSYVISVNSKDIEMDDCGWIGYISREQLHNTYDLTTGYGPIDEDVIV